MAGEESVVYRTVLRQWNEGPPGELAALLLERGELDLAAKFSKLTLRHMPYHSDLITLLTELEPNDATIAFMEPYLKRRPVLVEWHRSYQTLIGRLDPDHDLQSEYQRLSDQSPDDADLLYLVGRTIDDPEMSLQLFLKAASAPGDPSPHAHYAIGYHHGALGEFSEALVHVEKALRLLPNNPTFRLVEEDLRIATQDYLTLIGRYEKELESRPYNESAALTLAGYYAADGNRRAAAALRDRWAERMRRQGASDEAVARFGASVEAVMAEWEGDIGGFLDAAAAAGDSVRRYESLVLTGKLADAVTYLSDELGVEDAPISRLLIYALAKQSDLAGFAGDQLAAALEAAEPQPKLHRWLHRWFAPGARPPGLDETRHVTMPNGLRRTLLAALGVRHPGRRELYWSLAEKLNYNRAFPSLALQQLFGASGNPPPQGGE